jgi:drug/metabolite transporter (DMT)-like permease
LGGHNNRRGCILLEIGTRLINALWGFLGKLLKAEFTHPLGLLNFVFIVGVLALCLAFLELHRSALRGRYPIEVIREHLNPQFGFSVALSLFIWGTLVCGVVLVILLHTPETHAPPSQSTSLTLKSP